MPTRNEPLPPADEGPVERPLGLLPERDEDGEPYTTERLALWLDAKYRRHHEEEDGVAAARLRNLEAEVQRCKAAIENLMAEAIACDLKRERLHKALLSVADAARESPYRAADRWDGALAKLIAHHVEFLRPNVL